MGCYVCGGEEDAEEEEVVVVEVATEVFLDLFNHRDAMKRSKEALHCTQHTNAATRRRRLSTQI